MKSDSHLPKKFALFTSLKNDKNAFYFILKAFSFTGYLSLSWLNGLVENTAW